ncbi:MAG: hypothetical protein WA790_18970 [Sulfitobacter sp.]
MAKKSKTNQRKQAQAAKSKVVDAVPMTRRDVLRYGRNAAIGVAAVAGLGYVARGWFQDFQAEHDLTQIGQGKPAVVQVHDPQCPTCTALQRETRVAMEQFGECDLLYLVADIKQAKGAEFAALHNVPHVTLILFDGKGEVSQVLRGMRQRDELRTILAGHFEAHGSKV